MPLGAKQFIAGGSFDSSAADTTNKLPEGSLTVLSGSADAIPPHSAGLYQVNRAGVDAMTLAAPTAGDSASGGDDGKEIHVFSTTAQAHTITATGLFQDGAGHVNTATFSANAGANIRLMAFNGKWIVLSLQGVTMS